MRCYQHLILKKSCTAFCTKLLKIIYNIGLNFELDAILAVAVGGNQQSATMMGLNVPATKMKAYMLSSFLCSIGGICYCMNTMSGSVQQALGFEMNAIVSRLKSKNQLFFFNKLTVYNSLNSLCSLASNM